MTAPSHPTLLIVAHGSPSEPGLQECALRLVAGQVAHEMGGRPVRGVTLAAREVFRCHVERFPNALVYPLFMSDGWFVSTALPKRLAEAGGAGVRVLPPLGLDPALPALMAETALTACTRAGLLASETTLVIAAHGSPSDPRPRRATERVAAQVAALAGMADVRTGYVDEAPGIAEAARVAGPAVCLPFFAARAGHVLGDLPEALAEAGFEGPVLEPVGTWPQIPALIAAAATRAVEHDAA